MGYNAVTAAATLPVLEALLPGAPPLRWSTPAPDGLPGGYPVTHDFVPDLEGFYRDWLGREVPA